MNPLTSLRHAVVQEEEMDAITLPDARYHRVLRHLARINRVTLAQRPTLAFLAPIMRARGPDAAPLKILDVGFGEGDMLRAIARLATPLGCAVDLHGIDLNPRSAASAAAATPPEMAIRWWTGDYQDHGGAGWDIIISSLVAHHMTPDERAQFLRFMESEAAVGWLVNDLHRRRLPFVGYPLLATIMAVDPIVRRDGQLSIARSFRPDEWHAELAAAGITAARVSRWFPWRLVVTRAR